MNETTWLLCPECAKKTRIKIGPDTLIRNLPLYCPKCKKEHVINVYKTKLIKLDKPDALTQS